MNQSPSMTNWGEALTLMRDQIAAENQAARASLTPWQRASRAAGGFAFALAEGVAWALGSVALGLAAGWAEGMRRARLQFED